MYELSNDKYCIYLRKSRADAEAEARGELETLARHQTILLEYAHKMGITISKIFKEVVSGETIASRPQMQQLLAEVEQGIWDGVLVVEVERLARGDTIDQGIVAQTFKYSNTLIVTPMRIYDPNKDEDEEYFEFGLFMSRREYKTIKRRLERGRIASVKEGKWVGNVAPYGYERVRLEKGKGFTLKPLEKEADVVRMIYDFYLKGEVQEDGTYRPIGCTLIAKRLNELGIKPRNAQKWSTESVRGILTNPVYIGKVRWAHRPAQKQMSGGVVSVSRPRSESYIIADGLHDPIISEEAFDTVQKCLKNNSKPILNDKHIMQNPLSRLVVCGKCGHFMQRRPYKNREASLICTYNYCDNVSSDLVLVEEHILDALRKWAGEYRLHWENYDKENEFTETEKNNEKIVKRLESELSTLQKQLDNAYDLLEQGVYTTEIFMERSKKIKEKIEQTTESKNSILDKIYQLRQNEEYKQNIIPQVEHLLEVYHTLPDAQTKNDMLKEVLEKVVYTKNVGGRWHASPDDFNVVIYPRLPDSRI